MPALLTDIGAASRDVVTAGWADPAIAARYPGARDGSTDIAAGYFDLLSDAQKVADARGALIGVERRRFAIGVREIVWTDILAGVPQAQLVDAEQGADGVFLAARIEIDLDAETMNLELFG